MYFLNEPVFCEKIKEKNILIYVISFSDFQTSSMVLISLALAFLIINKFENHRLRRDFWGGEGCLQILYIFVLRGGGGRLLTGRLLKLLRVIRIYTKLANFPGLDFPHFTTVRDQTLQFYQSKFSI